MVVISKEDIGSFILTRKHWFLSPAEPFVLVENGRVNDVLTSGDAIIELFRLSKNVREFPLVICSDGVEVSVF